LALLELARVNAGYGRAGVLFDASLAVEQGEVVMLAGRNGAGKSTTLKAVMGLIARTGEIRFHGQRVDRLEPFEIARLGIGYVPEDRRIFGGLTVAQNLEVGRRPARAGVPPWDQDKVFALFPNLAAMQDRPGDRMSGGEQKMLAIGRTLMGNPLAVLLDEPSEGLAPIVVNAVVKAIEELKRTGMTIVLAEQSQRFAERVADRVYRVEKGRLA
jgi:branched-chain amino acid transport system ATP-binding protein